MGFRPDTMAGHAPRNCTKFPMEYKVRKTPMAGGTLAEGG